MRLTRTCAWDSGRVGVSAGYAGSEGVSDFGLRLVLKVHNIKWRLR